jgi:enediyne biosynthesis protein E11
VSERAATASVREGRDPLAGGHEPHDAGGHDNLLAAWRDAREATLSSFASVDDRDRVPWGGQAMAARSLATARLMETWAHGLDCFAAFDVPAVDTARLRHVAWLGWKSLPHAFAVAGVEASAAPESLRVELLAPDGTNEWAYGPVVQGGAGEWCRVVTRRLRDREPRLVAQGPLASQTLRVARAFL